MARSTVDLPAPAPGRVHPLDSAARHSLADPLPIHPALQEGAAARALRWLSAGDARPTRAQAEAFAAYRHVGDPPADALVAAMRKDRRGRAQLEQALEHGVETVDDPLPELIDFFAELEAVPYWLDHALLERASATLNRVPVDTLVSLTAAVTLPGSYVSPLVNEVLLHGGDLHRRAAGRVTETVSWLVDCASPGGMERFGDGFKTTARVRIIHGYIRAGVGSLDDWDVETRGVPVNQLHYCVTMIPLLAVALGTVALGHLQSAKEREAVVHLYRYMSHLMGVVPELQVASLNDLTRLVWLAAWSEFDPDESSRLLTTAVLDSVDQLRDLTDGTAGQRLRRTLHRRVHHDLTRLSLGPSYAAAAGVTPLSAGIAVLPVLAAGNVVRDVAQRLTRRDVATAARRGHARRAADLARLKERVHTRPYRRDEAVDTVRSRADKPLASAG
ncbi:DUF2236 domain-containing protein [Nocardioides sp. zg-ZUI104]|uniref:oxygenase MpaB family protein n=1 Tax=Nocardioides faecalis TaxID=2803858 RepID=UPI001BCDB57F|nr:oxygenase MpaB family protein [Nocardioides faecalis]MBS4753815.1 DUF2236 domain-containing protein [Nocardioides faecalis]